MATISTSAQRRQAVLNRLNNNNRYSQYLKQQYNVVQAEKERLELEDQQKDEQEKKKSKASLFEKIKDTAGDLIGNVVSGALKGVEGIYDTGATLVGGVGGVFDKDFKNKVKKHVAHDFVGKNITNPMQNYFDDSYLNNSKVGSFIENVASGVGQMLPAVVSNLVVPGSGMITMGLSATGNATESAFNDGASYYKGMLYGGVSGAVEMATEKMFANSLTKNINSSGYLDKLTKNVAKTGLAKVGKEMLEEGTEEAVAEFVNPLTKTIYKGKDGLNEFLSKEHLKNVGESALVGGVTSLAFGETLGKVGVNKINANESLAELKALEIKEDNLHARGQLFEGGNEQKISKLRTELKTQLSDSVSKMNEKNRAEFIKNNNLGSILNADGSLITNVESSSQTINNGPGSAKTGLASLSNKEAYSPKFFGRESELLIKPTSKQLTNAHTDAKLRINKLNKGYNRVGFAIVDDGAIKNLTGQDAKAIEHKGVIYIEHGADMESSQKVLATHELNHTLEGTKQKAKFDEFVIKSMLENETLANKFGDYNKKFVETFNRYKQVFTEKYGDVSKATTEDIAMMMQETDNEVISQYVSETMFTDEATIERLASTDESIFKKVYNWIKSKVERFKIKSAEDRQVYDFLHKAKSLYKKALENSRGGQNSIHYSIDKEDKKGYNKSTRKVVKYIPYSRVGNDNVFQIRRELGMIYNGFDDCVADGVAIESGDKVFIVDSSKEDGDLRFGIRKQINISNNELRQEYIRRTNYESVSKGYISDGLSSRFRDRYDNNRSSNRRQESGKELSVDSRESTNNKERISKQDADRRGIKYSLSKDSDGNNLTEDQADFFKDSKVRDENGNLLVCYHGRKNIDGLNIFDMSERKGYGRKQVGAYFTSNKEYAESYPSGRNNPTIKAFINIKNPYIAKEYSEITAVDSEKLQELKENGYDGVIYKEIDTTNPFYNDIDEYLVFEPNQIKSTTNIKPTLNNDIRFSLSKSVEEDVLKEFGKTYDWRETGYILKDGSKLDLSGKKQGSRGGSRSIDHREIFDIYEDADTYGTEAMIEFMGMGNIRVSPEYPGINIQIEPTVEQYEQIESMVDRLGWQNKAFIVDIDNHLGETIETMEYEGAVSGRKVVADIKYYFKEGKVPYKSDLSKFRFSLSKGQVAKDRANNSKMKVYSKIEAEKLINEIVAEKLNIGDKFGTLRGKSKAQAINQMFIALNSADAGYRIGIAQNIADYIIENSIYEDIYQDGINEEFLYQYDTLKEYRGKLDLDSIKGEIRHKFDDKANAIIMQWGKRTNTKGLGVDEIVMELQESGIQIDATNDADQFFEILDVYNKASAEIKKSSQKFKADNFGENDLKVLKQDIVRDILRGFDKYGSESKFAGLVKKYTDRINFLKETVKDLRDRNKAINGLFATIDRVKGLEKFKSADIELSKEVLGLINLLKGVKTYRNNLSKNIRAIMLRYSSTVEGKKLYDLISNSGNGIENPVAQMIEDIAHNNGELSTNEIRQLDEIMKNFIHNVKEYNRVFFEGKTQNDEDIVRQAIKETREAVALKTTGFLGSMSKFTRWLTSPVWRFERLSSYRQDGIMTRIFGELQRGVDNQARFNMQVAEHFKPFIKEYKKIMKDWNKQTFDLNGEKLSRGQVITLYMLFQRKQSQGHLLNKDGISGTIRVANENFARKGNFADAIAQGKDIEIDYTTLETIEKSLTDIEREFIDLSRLFFDHISKNAKYKTDMALYGISNVGEENYIPIRVADDQIYKQLGGNEISFAELFSVYNASFNKETKPNAKNKIVVENILDVINRHSKQMSSYYGLAVPLKTINRLYNKKLDDGSKLSIEINKVDPEFERYLSKLLSDMQGRRNPTGTFDKIVGKIRSLGAKASLGLNLKVLANQFVSLPASKAVGVEYRNIMKGLAMATTRQTDYDKLTEYCPMLYERFREGSNIDVGLLKESQGVLGKVDALTDLTTAPIGKIDKFICGAVWNACLEQTKDSTKYADYSHEHYVEAGKLTEKAVIKTQSNYTALYRPEILRTQNSFLQLSTMFMSEPLQQLSLLASSLDKIYVAKKLLKQNDTPENRALLKQAKTEARTAITAVTVDMILLTLIAQAFKWVKGQDDEEKVMDSMIDEFTGNFVGMFPFIKDLYTLYQGYDVTNMAYTGLTNIYNAFKETYNIVDLIASGEQYSPTEIKSKLRKALMGITQTFGIPLRNLETYTKGIVEKFSPSYIYRYESMFYNNSMSSYTKELNKAIENGDDKLADTIIDVMLADEKVEVKDKKVRETMKTLFEEGLDVFPRSVGKTIIYDGESIELTKRQHDNFVRIYSQANEKVSSLINSKGFEDTTSTIKAKSIKFIYDHYYEEAIKDLLGIDSDAKKYLFAQAIDIVTLSKIVSQASQIEADTDKNGKTVLGSKKSKITQLINSANLTAVQKYMLMGYFGYKNTNGERQVKLYIESLKLTKTEKQSLLKMSGYGD